MASKKTEEELVLDVFHALQEKRAEWVTDDAGGSTDFLAHIRLRDEVAGRAPHELRRVLRHCASVEGQAYGLGPRHSSARAAAPSSSSNHGAPNSTFGVGFCLPRGIHALHWKRFLRNSPTLQQSLSLRMTDLSVFHASALR